MALMRNFSCKATGVHKRLKQETIRSVTSGVHDRWVPERLGVRTFDPTEPHRQGLAHRPGSVVPQKHTFTSDYFRSKGCRALLKVAWQGAVTLDVRDGHFISVANRTIKSGDVVEMGVLRGIGMGVLDHAAPNPFVFKLGQDFLLKTGFPWGKYSDSPLPPFLVSGAMMFYERSASKYNVELSVKESPVEGFEFDAVAVEDIPAGTPLVRRVADESVLAPLPQLAKGYHMSDEQVDSYLEQCRQLEEARADSAGVEPDELHEDVIREHLKQTRAGAIPPIFADRTVTLPHPMWGGYGVFACEDIQAGEVVATGLHGKIEGLQGDKCPYVFTWNKDGRRYTDGRENTWATGSGNAMFYNSDHPANCRMYRLFDHFRFIIVAKTDIREGEEVMHLYASSSWRKCFVEDEHLPKLLPVESAEEK